MANGRLKRLKTEFYIGNEYWDITLFMYHLRLHHSYQRGMIQGNKEQYSFVLSQFGKNPERSINNSFMGEHGNSYINIKVIHTIHHDEQYVS